MACATIASLNPTIRYKVARIAIAGEREFSESDLLTVMATKTRNAYLFWKPLPEFEPEQFTNDLSQLTRFYQMHGYYSAKVEYDLAIRDSEVTVLIHTYPRARRTAGQRRGDQRERHRCASTWSARAILRAST